MEREIPSTYSPPGMLDWPCGVERLPNGNTLIADAGYWSGTGSEIIEVDRFGRVVWNFSDDLVFVHSAKILRNGNIMVTDTWNDRILEISREKKVVWSSETWGGGSGQLSDGSHLRYPNDAEETDKGTFLVSDRDNNRMIEVDKDGNIPWAYTKLKHCHDADRLPNGNTIVASSDENKIIEVDREGRIQWSYGDGSTEMLNWPRDADRLDNGNTLITDSKNSRVIEVDKAGEIVWSFDLGYNAEPYEADRLSNGNTLIAIQQHREVIEVDPAGNIIWQFRNFYQGHIQESLKNNDFELEAYPGAEAPAGWIECNLLSQGPAEFNWDSVNYLTGSHSVGLDYKGIGCVWWQQTLRVRPGALYRLSDTVKTLELDGFVHTHLAFIDRMGGFFTNLYEAPTTKARKENTDRDSQSIEVRAPKEATAVDIRFFMMGKGKAWCDQISFEELPWG